MLVAPGFDESTVLRLAASLERLSEHPIAKAVVAAAQARALPLASVQGFMSITGQGVRGEVEGRAVAVGNAALLRPVWASAPPMAQARAARLRGAGSSVLFVSIDATYAGLIAVADRIRDTTPEALSSLRNAGLRLVMLTGDHESTARRIARTLGIDQVIADVRPDEKAATIQRLRRDGRRVAMAGDGINDAPALAAADVGIAMGTGADVAIHSAHVTLVKGDLRAILRARRLSAETVTNIRQNLFFAFVYNALGVPIAAGALYPWTGLVLTPAFAAAAMSISSVSVVLNALRLNRAASQRPARAR